MMPNLRLAKIFWTIPVAGAFVASLCGVIWRDIYVGLFAPEFLPGALPQDILTLLLCPFLFLHIVRVQRDELRRQVVIAGLIGSLLYLYGIFTIERVYNALYLVYALIFASSFWSLVYGLSALREESLAGWTPPRGIARVTAWSSIVIAVIFTALWTAALVPIMREHTRIEYLYSIYILDLCFIMPAFFITGVMTLRGKPIGTLLGPAIMLLGFFVIFPLGLNELSKPSFGLPVAYGPMAVSFLFAAYLLGLAVLQLRGMVYGEQGTANGER